jgi:inosine-uridine nucleoside N-ribohydrolase
MVSVSTFVSRYVVFLAVAAAAAAFVRPAATVSRAAPAQATQAAAAGEARHAAAAMPVIFDTDMDSDVDDVAALCQLHAMADQGEVEMLAVMISGHNEWSGPCADAVDTFYGRPDLPIGRPFGERAILQHSPYAREVAQAFPQDFAEGGRDRVASVDLYRKLLAGRPDRSVTIISVGDLTNLAALLASPPDRHSPLGGRSLVAAKVAQYVCMGSRYPADTDPGTGRWGNFRTDPESARQVVARWPTMITFTGGGRFAESMAIGRRITALDPAVWPVSRAYRSYFQNTKSGPVRHTADSIAVFVAVRGAVPHFKVVDRGHNEIDEVGRNVWVAAPDAPNQRYTSELADPAADAPKLAETLEGLATRPPQVGLPKNKKR